MSSFQASDYPALNFAANFFAGGGKKKFSEFRGNLRGPRIWSLRVRAARQAHGEDRALPRFARHGYVATHHARELARDGEAETGATEALRGRGIGLGEFLEQLGLLLSRHADAAIGNGEFDPVVSVSHPPRPQSDLALFGEFAGIA